MSADAKWSPHARHASQSLNASIHRGRASAMPTSRVSHQGANNHNQNSTGGASPSRQIGAAHRTSNRPNAQRLPAGFGQRNASMPLHQMADAAPQAYHPHLRNNPNDMVGIAPNTHVFFDSYSTSQQSSPQATVPRSMDHTRRTAAYSEAPMAAGSTPSNTVTTTTVDHMKTLLHERIPENQQGRSSYKGHIRGAADFRRQQREYLSLSFRPAGNAGDFPTSDQALRKLAKDLSDAMLDFDGAIEAGQKSVARIFQLSPYEVELKSWEFLYVLRDVQLGRVGLPGWGKLWAGEDFACFMERYNDALSKLKVSKSIVSSMFDQDFSVRLALAPAGELKKKIANMNNNAKRAIDLAKVRDDKKRKLEMESMNNGNAYDSMGSQLVTMSRGQALAQMGSPSPSFSGQRAQTYIAAGDQSPGGGHPSKRSRIEDSYTTNMRQTQGCTQRGFGNEDMGTSIDGEKVGAGYFEPPELVDTPGFTPSSEFTEFTEENTGYTALPVDESNTAKLQDLGTDLNDFMLLGFPGFDFTGDNLTFDSDWNADFSNDPLSANAAQNAGGDSEALKFNPEDFNLPDDAAIFDAAQNYDGGDLTLNAEQDYDLPVDAPIPDEALPTISVEEYHRDATDPGFDDQNLGDALALEAVAHYNRNAADFDLGEDLVLDGWN